jgi:hypothetical protein
MAGPRLGNPARASDRTRPTHHSLSVSTHSLAEDLRWRLDQHADDVNLVRVDQVPVGDRDVPAGQAVDRDPAGSDRDALIRPQ